MLLEFTVVTHPEWLCAVLKLCAWIETRSEVLPTTPRALEVLVGVYCEPYCAAV